MRIQFYRPPPTMIACLVVSSILAGVVQAHHSPAVFDRTRTISLNGTITSFSWSNPHSWIHMNVTDESGDTATWTVEMNPATILARGGWRRNSLQPGDEVTVIVHPLRSDERGGQFIAVTLPDGSTLGEVPAVLGESPER